MKRFFVAFGVALISTVVLAGTTWDGGDGDNYWNWNNNWNPDGSPSTGTGVDLTFAGNTRLSPVNNYADWSDFRAIYFASGAGSFTITGNNIDFFDTSNGGKIENNSSVLQTFSVNNFSINSGTYEFNPVSGSLTLGGGGNIYNNGNSVEVWGDNGHTLTIAKDLTGGGGLTVQQNSIVQFTAASTYTGDTAINEGSVRIGEGGSLGSTIVRVGRSSGSDAAGFYISDANGGTTEDASIVIRSGSSGTLTVGGLNTSGNNTFSGQMSLDNNVTLSAAAGGRTIFSGAILDGAGAGNYGAAINAAGTVQLAGSSANSGQSAWTLQEGTLELNKSVGVNAINSAGITIENGGTMVNLAAGQVSDNGNVTIQSGGAWNLNNNNESINSLDLQSGSTLSLGTGDLTINSQAAGTWAGTINGSAGSAIVKVGNTTQSITGNNSFDGDLYIDGGTIGLNHNNAVSSAATVHIGVNGGANNSTLDSSVAGTTIGADIVVESGTGSRTINQAAGSGTVTFSGDVTLNKDVSVTAGSGETLTLSGTISGGNKVTIGGGGGTVNLSGNSTYTGNTEIDNGTLNISGDISGSSTLYLGNGLNSDNATLQLSGSGVSIGTFQVNTSAGSGTRTINATAGSHTISGTSTINRDTAINASAGSLTFSGSVDLDNASDYDLNINASGGSVEISGAIVADTGGSQINKSGAGTLTISGNNASSLYMLNIADGTVALNNNNAIGVGYSDKVNFTGSSTLDVNASAGHASLGLRAANGVTATIDVQNGSVFSVATLAVISGTSTFDKTGAGTMNLTGSSGSFSGGTLNINQGTVNVSGTLGAGTVNVTGGTLAGDGGVNTLVVGNGGVLSPGNSPGVIYAGNTTWDNGGTYLWEINDVDAGAGTGWDLLDITGTLTINAGFNIDITSLTLGNVAGNVNDFDGTQDYINTWLIASASGGVTLNASPSLNLGNFSNPYQAGAWSFSVVGNNVYLNYDYDPLGPPIGGGGGGGDPSAVPEPNVLSFAMLAGLLMISFRYRLKRNRQTADAIA